MTSFGSGILRGLAELRRKRPRCKDVRSGRVAPPFDRRRKVESAAGRASEHWSSASCFESAPPGGTLSKEQARGRVEDTTGLDPVADPNPDPNPKERILNTQHAVKRLYQSARAALFFFCPGKCYSVPMSLSNFTIFTSSFFFENA